MSAAPRSPWAVSPTGWPNHVPSDTTMWPGVTRFSVAGITITAVKIGMNSQTRFTNDHTGRREAQASTSVTR